MLSSVDYATRCVSREIEIEFGAATCAQSAALDTRETSIDPHRAAGHFSSHTRLIDTTRIHAAACAELERTRITATATQTTSIRLSTLQLTPLSRTSAPPHERSTVRVLNPSHPHRHAARIQQLGQIIGSKARQAHQCTNSQLECAAFTETTSHSSH